MIIQNRNRVPDTYFNKSRDFQLLCNTYDCADMAVKFDIDSILNLIDTEYCNEMILPLLQTKLGFFTNIGINGKSLRTILKGFPYLIKNKGTRTGIKQCIHLFMNAVDISRKSDIEVININKEITPEHYINLNAIYVVKININSERFDIQLLKEMLKYIIPAGYGVEYHFYEDFNFSTSLFSTDTVNIVFVNSVDDGSLTHPVSELSNELIPDTNQATIFSSNKIMEELDE